MKLIFAGTPEFAAHSLDALINSHHEVVAVLTQPDRPAGRGKKLTPSAVKSLAVKHDIAVFQPLTLKSDESRDLIQSLKAEVMVVVAYGLLLPKTILDLPDYGCLNIHASLLPRWRGAAPIQRAIEAGDDKTGISIMQMDEGLDTGDVLKMAALDIEADDTATSLHDKLADLGADLITRVLDELKSGSLTAQPQDHAGASYAEKLHRRESWIDWNLNAQAIVRKIHAFNPWPGCKTRFQQVELKLLRAKVVQGVNKQAPGTVIDTDNRIVIQAQDEAVEILSLQKPGGRALSASEFLNGFKLTRGDQFS